MASVRDFIINASGNFYMSPNLHVDEKSEDILSDFIHNSPTILQTNVDSNNQLHFYTQIQWNLQKSVVFYKTIPQDLTSEDALNHLNIITLTNNAAESLYQILKQVYSPLLAAGDSLYSNKLQKNLSDLESNLRALTHGKGGENINVILTIEDEVDYWKRASQKNDASKKEREAASAYCVLFEDVSGEIRIMQSSPMVEVRDSAENIGGILDDIWRCTTISYEEGRMLHIFDVVGHIICSTIQKAITGNQLWKIYNNSKDNDILTLVTESLNVIQTWISACKSLTETYWPNYALHTWNGKPYIPSFCLNFKNRIQEIYDIRSTYNQLSKLLTKSEKEELRADNLFEAFESINIWIYNGPNHSWESAVSIFSAKLRPIEIKIAEKLKPRMRNTSIKQTLYEFIRYKTLINRHHVKQALFEELEVFVSSLLALLKSIQGQLDADDGDVRMYQPPEMSPIIQQVQWAKQTEARVKDIQACTESYLTEFEGSLEVLKLSSQLLKDLKSMYTQLHEEWSRDLQAQVKDGSLALSGDKPVVEFSGSSRLMVVTFNPRLVRAEREARALAAAGLPPPPAALALHALTAVLGQARALHQVASFHNTLGERMIPSTRPMMLAGALELAALVRDQRPVYWTDSVQLAAYTDTLKNMLLKLETQNNYLTSQHIAIRSIVEKLLNTELLAKQAEWKKKIKDIRDIIEKTEANGYKSTEMWRAHWDQQLYKALECQYIRALLSLHSHFPHVKVDLILRGHRVRVQPAMEEVRAQHYAALRRLVALPAQFVGLGAAPADTRSVFAPIVDKHSWLGNKAVRQLEGVLASLERACEQWTRRAALACVRDLDVLCAEHLRDPQDWELNFKACKAYGQAVAKMAFEDEKIEWITVGTAGLRRELEAAARLLWGALAGELRGSCARDAAAVRAFADGARLALAAAAVPRNAKELAELSAKQRAVHEKTDEMEQIVENLKKKGHMLRTWGGDPFVDDTIKEWQKIREQMASHKQMFEHQAELVKSSLSGEWESLCSAVEAWASRWGQARARLADVHDAVRADMLARARDVFDAIASLDKCFADRDYLLKECEKFNMKCEISEIWNEAEKLKKEYEILWSPLKEYNEDYEALGEQEWMLFQKKLHLLDEFVLKWSAKLEPYTVVTLFIKQELDKYSDLTTALKYLRGSDFTELHWREVYSLVNMEYKKPDTLQLKDLLGVAANVKKQLKELQKIYSTASNEATIRSALNELELWYAGARLSVVQHGDKAKRLTPIVKDFKEILNKIEEQQWVVSSLGGANDACAAWDGRLRAARALVRSTHHAQRRWLYLEPILCDDDGELGAKFRKVDQGFRQAARALAADPRLSALVQSPRLQPMLDAISDQLNSCQAALNLYIDEKRSVFPRLYFLSDDDLLELLGQARAGAEGRESVMQSHLKKLFPGITGVRLGPGELSITALCSDYGEIFQMEHPVDIDCPVEIWLKKLETEIRSSLQNMTLKCIVSNSLQQQDPFSLPTQILCLAQNIRFTDQAEKAITSKELHKLKTSVERENINYATAEVDEESEKRKRQALILQCSYYLSVVQILIDNNVDTVGDWYWQKQLRFYLKNSKDIVAKMGLAEISYSYEYLGVNTGQFVRTEVADECFLILTQALHLGLVGNPFGPAGTGKTESVKALGALVGRLVLIFNCDEAMDGECMGRLLSGLALSGAWGCFDEFNRLGGGTLAAVAHQLCALLDATRARAHGAEATALLNGKQVRVSEWCGVAATMNPAGRGYGGRRALPGAVARALRPVALQPPPARPLARQLFAAQGVACADALAADIQAVFEFASTLLSDQRHYDWGLRALKAAVGSCGVALATAGEKVASEQRAVLRRVLRLNNLSKLTRYDAESFENILLMVFADVPEEEPNSNPIYAGLEVTVANLGLVRNNHQIQKCVELYEQLQQRMGVVIVGPPGSGKSTIRRLLKTTLQQQQGKSIVEYVIYPKAMSRNYLLGYIDPDTRQWTDGVMSTVALEVSNQPSDVWSWVVCDGDVDPEWVEALNSVLDDNRLLTLPSGGRVRFAHNVNFLFETHSLHHASPATISRLGIILLSEESNCSSEIAENWLAKAEFENETAKLSLPLLNQAIKKCMQWFNSHRSDVAIKFYDISMVKQIITQFEYVAQESTNMKYTTPEELVFRAIQRSTNDILKESAVDSFYDELRVICGGVGMVGGSENPVGGERAGEWASEELYVSERVAARLPALRALLADPGAHVLMIGPDACAKSTIADYILKENNATVITIDCTPILEPTDIIEELKRHNVIGSDGRASGGGRVTLFVRGLDRARVDAWGSSAVHSFLLQVVREGGAWSRAEGEAGPQWRRAARLRLLLTARRAAATPRLAAALALFSMPEPDDDELLELSRSYLKENITRSISDIDTTTLARSVLSMFKEVIETFSSIFHCKWNPSHLKKWCENIKWYNVTSAADVMTSIKAEADCIFKDSLITDEEKTEFDEIAKRFLRNYNSEVFYKAQPRSDGIYLEAVDYSEWCLTTQKLINQCLSENENMFGETGVEACPELAVLYKAACRAASSGVVVMVGGAGCGRRAAARLAGAALPAAVFVAENKDHVHSQFRAALSSASDGRTLLVLGESSVTEQTLACVEAWRAAREPHALPAALRPHARLADGSRHAMLDMKQNLGIIICLDKDQDNLGELMEKYPFIYTESHLVWQERWSEATLRRLPALIIQRLKKENITENSENQCDEVPVEGFVKVYNSLETESQRTPCRYVCFVKSYYHIATRKRDTLLNRRNMLSAGVEALRRARTEVATLQRDAAQQEAELSEERAAGARALDQIGATVRATTDRQDEMQTLKVAIEQENDALQTRKKEIEAELASVEPVIAAARAAVGDIRPESLSEVRSLRAPPDVVRDILEGVLRLMGIADTSWHSMKNFLSKRGVKEDIRNLDVSQVSEEAVSAVERLVARRGASFEPAAARRASAACAPLAAWVRAHLAHAAAERRVRPLRDQQNKLQKNLKEAEDQLAALSSGLATVDERVGALKEQLGRHSREAAALELRLAAAAGTIHAARRLLDQLAGEYDAWEIDLQNISKEIIELSQRSLLAAAYIVYLPDLTEPQARLYITKWSSLIGFDDPSISIINYLSSAEKQLKWEGEGLSSDESAVKNAVWLDQALQIPKCDLTALIIDPDGEAIEWLKRTMSDTPCQFISQDSDKLQTTLQYANRLNRVVVVTDVESLASAWWGGVRVVLATRRAVPTGAHAPPHIVAKLAPLHFAARPHALADQLVNYAIQKRNPEVNEKSKEIKQTRATLQRRRLELQENLLSELSMKGDILNDANLLASLNKMRETSATISEALASAQAVEVEGRSARDAYSSSGERAAALALALRRLAARRPLLALPADTALDAFVDALATQDPKNIDSDRVTKYFTKRIIERVLLSLHKKDKYAVVLYLLKYTYAEIITNELWQLFLGTCNIIEDQESINHISSTYRWIDAQSVKKVAQLKMKNEDLFNRLCLDKVEMWKEFVHTGELHVISKLSLSAFETVTVAAVMRPGSVYRAVVAFVDYILGSGVMSGGGEVARALRWSRATRPVLLLAAHAADVLSAHALALSLSLVQVGIEEGRSAWEAGLEGTRGGGWLMLAVGASPFPRELRDFLASLATRPAEYFSEVFRLWVACEDREVPLMISNLCVSVVIEAPSGVKHNAAGSLGAWRGARADARLQRHLACLALFHALAQERRAYIPLGWSAFYEWGWSEVFASGEAARAAGAGRAARELCGALYAARVPGAADRRVLAALLRASLAEAAFAHAWRPPGFPAPLPYATDMQAYMTAFEALPEIDSPQLLCLPANCRVAWETNAADVIISGLRDLDTAASSKKSDNLAPLKSDSLAPLKSLLALWKKLMSGSPLIKGDYQVDNRSAGWWGAVCGAEALDAARAARRLHAALSALAARARRPDADITLDDTPEEWQVWWAGPARAETYVREFCHRARAAHARLQPPAHADADYMPSEVDLREWLSPQRVVCALRARTASRLARAPHALRVALDWDASPDAKSDGQGMVTLHGLRLSGCSWAAGGLRASATLAPPHTPAPPLRLRCVPVSESEVEDSFSLPLYSSEAREALVLAARAPLAPGFARDTAILHAAALFVASLD